MGKSLKSDSLKEPDLQLQFANLNSRETLGKSLSIKCPKFILNDISAIPDYGEKSGFGLGSPVHNNDDYYRDIAVFLCQTYHLSEYGLVVYNNSDVLAENVFITIDIKNKNGLKLFDEEDFPSIPYANIMSNLDLKRTMQGSPIPNIQVNKHGNNWHLESNFGNIQPGAKIWSKESFYIGALKNYEAELNTQIVANNLKKPITLTLNILFETSSRELKFTDIQSYRRTIEY